MEKFVFRLKRVLIFKNFFQWYETCNIKIPDIPIINKSLEDKEFCSAVFLDIEKAFNKVWHNYQDPLFQANIQSTRVIPFIRNFNGEN